MAAAVLDKAGNVLSTAANSYIKTHPKQALYASKFGDSNKNFLHAEMSALVKAKEGVPYKMVVVRVGKGGSLRNAAPCPICSMAIRDAGIKTVEYTT